MWEDLIIIFKFTNFSVIPYVFKEVIEFGEDKAS